MARKKATGPKYKDVDVPTRRVMAEVGRNLDQDALEKAAAWLWDAERMHVEGVSPQKLVEQAAAAHLNGDDRFFEMLAFLTRHRKGPGHDDPLRAKLLFYFFGPLGDRQLRLSTLSKTRKWLERQGLENDPTHLRRVCKELGIRLVPDQVGRPRKRSQLTDATRKKTQARNLHSNFSFCFGVRCITGML